MNNAASQHVVGNAAGRKIPGIVLSLFLIWAVVFNVSMLPYPVWFEVVSVLGIVTACLAGVGQPGRRVRYGLRDELAVMSFLDDVPCSETA